MSLVIFNYRRAHFNRTENRAPRRKAILIAWTARTGVNVIQMRDSRPLRCCLISVLVEAQSPTTTFQSITLPGKKGIKI
jgi:hypothetical protein